MGLNNYTPLHLHSDASNFNMVEVVSTYEDYVNRAKELGMTSLAYTEHGNVINWYQKLKKCQAESIKFIFAVETYLTWDKSLRQRDNMHIILIARNDAGKREITKLTSQSYCREDNSFYYNPRIDIKQLENTSDNVIILTACLASPFWRFYKNGEKEKLQRFGRFCSNNKHRVFLEIQNHNHDEQKEYNALLRRISKHYDMKLVATGDVHAVNPEHDRARKILQKAKGIEFSDEDAFKLHLQSYDEMFDNFMMQDVLTEKEIKDALEQTNIIADMIEEYTVDYSFKYPRIFENSMTEFNNQIQQGIIDRGIDKLPNYQEYMDRISYETKVYQDLDAVDFMLLESMVKSHAREINVPYGFGRGSIGGALTAFILRITEVDPIKHNLSFERFMNPERISLPDIDSDYPKEQRHLIQDFLFNHPQLNAIPIMTANTLGIKGAIKDVARGLKISNEIADEISKKIDDKGNFNDELLYRERYPELFEYVDIVVGTTTSIGRHAAGVLITDKSIDLTEVVGTITTTKSHQPIATLSMKALDKMNFIKLDVLGLKNIDIIQQASDLAEIPFPTPDEMNTQDFEVWKSIREDSTGIFQAESNFFHECFKKLFSDESLEKIKTVTPDIKFIDLFSLCNAIIRPGGASIRDAVCNGEFTENGHPALNAALSSTMGVMAYQEQATQTLVDFAGYSVAEGDLIRRSIGKKDKETLEKQLPIIEKRFARTMVENFNVKNIDEAMKIVKPFIQILKDSADYSFNKSHSESYSLIGFATAYLRHYHKIEFATAFLNVNNDSDSDMKRMVEYMKKYDIAIKSAKFRHSRSGYMMSKETNTIYQGIASIAYLNELVAEELYKLKDMQFNTFTDLLLYIYDSEGCNYIKNNNQAAMNEYDAKIPKGGNRKRVKRFSFDSRQMGILIGLNFFEEFGNPNKLQKIYDLAKKKIIDSTARFKSSYPNYQAVLEFEKSLSDIKPPSLIETCLHELEYLGRCESFDNRAPDGAYLILEIKETQRYALVTMYKLSNGEIIKAKIENKILDDISPQVKRVISVENSIMEPKYKKDSNNEWYRDKEDREMHIKIAKIY